MTLHTISLQILEELRQRDTFSEHISRIHVEVPAISLPIFCLHTFPSQIVQSHTSHAYIHIFEFLNH